MINQIFYPAIVENRHDPLQLGRVQVRVFGVHSESTDYVPVKDLPWAISIMPATSASISGIGDTVAYVEGSMVMVFFMDGESKQQPIIMGSMQGLPQNKSSFSADYTLATESFDTNAFPVIEDGSTTEHRPAEAPPVEELPPAKPEETPETITPKNGVDISRAVAAYGSNVQTVYDTLLEFGITDDFGIIGILSNIGRESKFKLVRENMNYTSAEHIRNVFKTKTRFINDVEIQKYVKNPQALANMVYANIIGNGAESTGIPDATKGDGWRYRGAGFIQLTGRANFRRIGKKINVDLEGNPDAINDAKTAAKVVVQFFLDAFGAAKNITFADVESACSECTKKVGPGRYEHDYKLALKESELYSTSADKNDAAKEKETVSPTDPKSDLDHKATQAEIDQNRTIKKPLSGAGAIGFKDPKLKYPITSMLKEQDVNRLARRSTVGTIIESRVKNRRTDIKSDSSSFKEPLPAYNAVYPYNHVFFSESGHALEFDDSFGAERIHLYHKTGTFIEIDANGNQVNKIVGDSFSITERNGYIYIDGTARISVGSDVKLQVGGNLDITVDGNVNYDVGGNMTFKVGKAFNVVSGDCMSLRSNLKLDADAPMIKLNSGGAKQISVSERKGKAKDYGINPAPSFFGEASIKVDDADTAAVNAYLNDQVSKGVISKKELEDGDKAVAEKEENVTPEDKPVIPSNCEQFKDMKDDIPDNTQISPNYTIGMLSNKAAASKYKIRSQHGLTIGEIACNLKFTAINCLEPILRQYPSMIVTSGFRTGSGTSQHERGQAIDMQFPGVANSGYYEIAQWIRDNVPFDQLLLEYKTIESGRAWIHISYVKPSKDGESAPLRKQVFTYMNHKNTGSGLRKLQ
jgi:predicted chitinase/uncharacterized protein YcbK (DUF882 family)